MTKKTVYEWRKDNASKPEWRLLPVDGPKDSLMFDILNSIASITVIQATGGQIVKARYKWNSTGNKPENWVQLKTVPSAKKWVEANLAKFWEPPKIKT